MAETRPSGLQVVADASAPVVQEVVQVDERRRLHLLPRWAERVTWLPLPVRDDVAALMVFVEPGRLSLRCWSDDGPTIVERFEKIAKNSDEADLEVLRLIQDRYNRLWIRKDRRVHLGDTALQHLGLPIARGGKHAVYVSVFAHKIDVLSASYRDARLLAGASEIDDLP